MPIMSLQPQYPRSQARQRGPSGEPQDRQASYGTSAHSDRLASDSRNDYLTYYFASENDAYHYNQSQVPIYPSVISSKDLGPTRKYRERLEDSTHYRKVGRSQNRVNPAVAQVLNDTRLTGLDRHPAQSSNGYSQPRARLSQPTYAGPYLRESVDNSRSLRPSDLQEFDHTRGTYDVDRSRYLSEREEPYHNVGYVGWKSDYERK